ncbi:lipoyl(octanoyl) transferase LipB [Sphingomonas sp. R-74633]|uniref:lipoyl(octanoyl) transferase LipB n=1 Tax=Sphingomonas sp. R-74633 TaxID=2751188 RepID=UPI0015D31309|nr:lipoyl(octanoyl) transferase LipB [Sphingomonas sp. R-74633]NYT42946.1 lipoyl(octanoyl) transferase LipB [Sphingomonas sp. R-74633]
MTKEIEWRVSPEPIEYGAALAEMEAHVAALTAGTAPERIWLLEHPPVYTAGTSATDASELVDAARFPVFRTGRGGRYTYHGPGQRIGYLMLDLRNRKRDVRGYVHAVEGWVIAALGELGIEAFRAEGRIGIWTLDQAGKEAKIGAIGVRIRQWVTMHGFAVNLSPNLNDFNGIVPCGIAEFPVTSTAALGKPVTNEQFDLALRATFLPFLDALT